MKNLTAEQKEIVNKLVNEFTKLNEPKSNGEYTFLNYNALNAEKDRQLKGIAELRAHNESMNALIKNKIADIAKKLNDDISKGNLPLKVETTYESVAVKHINTKGYSESDARIYVLPLYEDVEFGHKAKKEYYTYSHSSVCRFSTIEGIINDSLFQQKLMYLIKKGF